jgi:CRP-like cAMP-binding protein
MPARPSLASPGADGPTTFRASLGEPVFHARAIGPAVVSIASATRAVTTRGAGAPVWAALSHGQGSTAWIMATALAKRSLPVRDRLRAELHDLAARFGRDTVGGRRIELPLTQDLLAELVGSARETVNRALRGLHGETWFEGRTYVVRAAGSPGRAGPSA